MRRHPLGWSWLGVGVLMAAGGVLSGCGDELGTCDQEMAEEVVYNPSGFPFAKGQALAHQSCGGGSFCHSAGAEGDARYGAPAGLNFDVQTLPADASDDALARVRAGRLELLNWDAESYEMVVDGEMPPGQAGREVTRDTKWLTREVFESGDADTAESALPSIDSAEGQEIFRNWLACGAPSLEQPRPQFPKLDPGTEATWDSIYPIVDDECATSACHGQGSSFNGGLVLEDKCAAVTNLVGQSAPAHSSDGAMGCGMDDGVLVQPGDASSSLFYLKLLEEVPCGSPMPLSGMGGLDPSIIMDIQEWINNGAQAPADCM